MSSESQALPPGSEVRAGPLHEDFISRVRSGVNGTPTFYVNGGRYDDSYELESLLPALERAAG